MGRLAAAKTSPPCEVPGRLPDPLLSLQGFALSSRPSLDSLCSALSVEKATCNLFLGISSEVADFEAGLEDVDQVHIAQQLPSWALHQR